MIRPPSPSVLLRPLLAAVLAATLACVPRQTQMNGEKAEWFRSVKDGSLIQRLNSELVQVPLLAPAGFPQKGESGSSPVEGVSGLPVALLDEHAPDAFPAVCREFLASAATTEELGLGFGRCLQELFRGSLLIREAIAACRLFVQPAPAEWLRRLDAGDPAEVAALGASLEIESVFSLLQTPGGSGASTRPELRRRYEASELNSLQKLILRFETETRVAAERASRVVAALSLQQKKELATLARYDWILKLAEGSMERHGLRESTSSLLDPYGYLVGVPEPGQELAPFSSDEETGILLSELERLGLGERDWTRFERWSFYLQGLESDRMMERRWVDSSAATALEFAPDAIETPPVQIAFVDTGVDLENYPELGLVIRPLRDLRNVGSAGFEFGSYDFADENQSPWMLAAGDLAHGTGTAATFLTQLARLDPGSVATSRYSVQSWKVASLRSLLAAGSDAPLTSFDPLHLNSFQRAVVEPVRALSERSDRDETPGGARLRPVPSIVSLSAAFPLYYALKSSGEAGLLLRAPWLWVMAAGNDRRELGATGAGAGTACFGDFPAGVRPSDNILCVGSVVRGIFDDTLSKRTNTGARVDLYTYEDVSSLCPEGTSCAAPSITAAAALLFQRYPGISAATVREALIAASEEKWVKREQRQLRLATQPAPNSGEAMVAIRFFDPSTMMEAAFEEAEARYREPAIESDQERFRAAQPDAVTR